MCDVMQSDVRGVMTHSVMCHVMCYDTQCDVSCDVRGVMTHSVMCHVMCYDMVCCGNSCHRSPSKRDSPWTMEGSFLAPWRNSSQLSLPSPFSTMPCRKRERLRDREITIVWPGRYDNDKLTDLHHCTRHLASISHSCYTHAPGTHCVHGGEDLIDSLLRRLLLPRKRHHPAHHLVDGIHYVCHLLPCYVTIMVVVIQLERPCVCVCEATWLTY